jgi:transcriptional coactivator p15 (PC4)
MTARQTIAEPIEIAKFWKNRRHDAIIVSLRSYEGRNFLDVRTHAMKDGCLVPTPKGVTVAIPRMVELAAAMTKALSKARDLGLLDDQGGSSE